MGLDMIESSLNVSSIINRKCQNPQKRAILYLGNEGVWVERFIIIEILVSGLLLNRFNHDPHQH